MKKKIVVFIMFMNLLLLSSCFELGGRFVAKEQKANERMEKIVAAIRDKDKESLKCLFSKKAIEEAEDFDSDADYLFELIQGNIESWELDGWSSDGLIDYGKRSLMIRYPFYLITDENVYHFYVIDYSTDTIDPDNEGIYMLELIKFTDEEDLDYWTNRMRAGIYIH